MVEIEGAVAVESAVAIVREVVSRAEGVVMLVYGVDTGQAFAFLRAAAMHSDRTLVQLAAAVLDGLPAPGLPGSRELVREHLFHVLTAARK